MPLATSVRAKCRSSRRTPRGSRSRSIRARAAEGARRRRRPAGPPRVVCVAGCAALRDPVPPTSSERYAVVSCHVERPLDDAVWRAFAELQERRPGGLAIAALLRPPDAEAGELDEDTWLARAREAAARGPLGHHTHFTSPTHARPTGGDPGERVRREGAWLRERGVTPTLFCGGGWYTDRSVAEACAELGYADCTPGRRGPAIWRTARPGRSSRPPPSSTSSHLVTISRKVGRGFPSCRRRTAPATSRARSSCPGLPPRVHAYFHDTDLLDRRRRALIVLGLGSPGAPPPRHRPRHPRRRGARERARRRPGRPSREERRPKCGRRILACRARRRSRLRLARGRATPPATSGARASTSSPAAPSSASCDARSSIGALVVADVGGLALGALRRARPPGGRLRRHDLLVAPLGHRPRGVAPVPRPDHRHRLPPGGPLRAPRAARGRRAASSPRSSSSR